MQGGMRILALGIAQITMLTLHGADLTGRVVDVTGGPIPATVELRREGDAKPIKTLATGAPGIFRLSDLLPDTYQLSFVAPGFMATRMTRKVREGDFLSLGDIVLQIGSIDNCPDKWDRPTIRLRTIDNGTEVSGGLEERGGMVLRRAAVILEGVGRTYRTTTDANGTFRFANIEPGNYALHLVKPGFAEFVIEGLRIRDRHWTEVVDHLQVPRCPENLKCEPIREILKVQVCL